MEYKNFVKDVFSYVVLRFQFYEVILRKLQRANSVDLHYFLSCIKIHCHM